MNRTSPEKSHVMQSYQTRTLVRWIVVVFVMGSVAGPTPAAATHGVPFFDDFSDMNFSDDMPVSWQTAPDLFPATLDASSGDLVLTTSLKCCAVALEEHYADISVRTQLRLLEGGIGTRLLHRS